MKTKLIGKIRNEFKSKVPDDYSNHISQIIIDKKYEKGLEALEANSHIIVLFWMDRITEKERVTLKVHPMKNKKIPLKGVFATRAPSRPNPIGLSVVKLEKRDKNILTVRGLDALDGSPVLDIKPYSRDEDFVTNPRMPKW